MKTQSLSTLIALASGASATFGDWGHGGGSFNCPGNTNNTCTPAQQSGFGNWDTYNIGQSIGDHGGFSFPGWTCGSWTGGGKKRTGSKCITGQASSNKGNSAKFGCGSGGPPGFSVDHLVIAPEFPCDLEFEYGMPGGQTCKHTAACGTGGSTVTNSQCGGATSVTVNYPSQTPGSPGHGKTGCSISVSSIGFSCGPPSSTSHASSTKPATTPATSTKPAVTTPTVTPSETKPSNSGSKPASSQTTPTAASETKPATTSSAVVLSSPAASTSGSSTVIFGNSTSVVIASSSVPTLSGSVALSSPSGSVALSSPSGSVATPSGSVAASTSSGAVGTGSSTLPGSSAGPSSSAGSSAVTSGTVTTPVATTPVQLTTSTISTTIVSTITSCAPTVTNCPAHSTVLTTLTFAISTTVCPVSETAQGTSSAAVPGSSTAVSSVAPGSTPAVSGGAPGSSAATSAVVTSATVVTPTGPATTAPCPTVLPACLNTWNFIVGCVDNTDHACYCPSADFVNSVYGCLSAYGANAGEIASAQSYFQGICAPYVPQNPAIVTGASSIPSSAASTNAGAASTPGPAIPVTTISVLTTLTVPCSQTTGISSGAIIPSSSTTSVLSTVITAPQVAFSTAAPAPPAGGAPATTPPPALVVGTQPAPAPVGVSTAVTPAATSVVGGKPTTIATVPVGTGAPSAGSPQVPFTGAASSNRITVGGTVFAMLFAMLAL